eukprot:1140731-Pelagomonas_calceolata.AAC.9
MVYASDSYPHTQGPWYVQVTATHTHQGPWYVLVTATHTAALPAASDSHRHVASGNYACTHPIIVPASFLRSPHSQRKLLDHLVQQG